jgi:malonyl-CoA/methylmalonyl-CoA synthetase
MRLFIAGSAPLLLETFQAWQQRTGHTILERYGMSETVMLTSNPYRSADGERRGGTVGFPAAWREFARLRVTATSRCPWGRSVASRCRGRTSSGLLAHAREDAEEFTADGYFRTGDGQV